MIKWKETVLEGWMIVGDKKISKHIVSENRVTYEVYANLPDDGCRYEVADGNLELMSPAPSLMHQAVSFELQKKLSSGCAEDYWVFNAPVDVILSDTEVRQPDLVMVHRSRASILSKKGIRGAPDLVVEITSEHSRKRDKVHKTKVYAKFGVSEYWIVDLTNFTLEQYELTEGRTYELTDVYQQDEKVSSNKISCVSFSMNDLTKELPELPD